MSDANTYIGINHDAAGGGNDASDYTIQSTAPSTDFFFYMAALDGNSNSIRRIDAVIALKNILRVLESEDTFTTEMQN